jgi:hypothetical protein
MRGDLNGTNPDALELPEGKQLWLAVFAWLSSF